jgi:hypothetical protein
MIAAIEKKHNVVWGYGLDKDQAYQMARKEWTLKSEDIKSEGFPKLSFHQLKPGADLADDGEGLYRFVIFEIEPGQQSLF